MQASKRNTIQIFIAVLITGIIGIAGELILTYSIDRLSENYKEITQNEIIISEYVCEIESLMYRHQICVSNHISAEDPQRMQDFEDQASELSNRITEQFLKLSDCMTGAEEQEIYHDAYSGYTGYLYYAGVTMDLSENGQPQTAATYCATYMADYLSDVSRAMDALKDHSVEAMNAAVQRMEHFIRFAKVCELLSISCIIVFVTICLIFCVRITNGLEKYRDDLLEEMDRKNSILNAHMRRLLAIQDSTIWGMANLIENRDGDTGMHVKRTSNYVKMISDRLMEKELYREVLDAHYAELTVKAAPLHDVGKIVVSDVILNKPGKLTPEEFEKMKTHTTEGSRIVGEVLGDVEEPEYMEIARQVAMSHHEKWDGSGYPQGLKQEEIPLCARIMAIADVFDALISKRCYKSAFPVEEAFAIIEQSGGSHFDPVIAATFLELKPEIIALLTKE